MGTVIMVDDGKFEGKTDHITVIPEKIVDEAYKTKFGKDKIVIPVEQKDAMQAHVATS